MKKLLSRNWLRLAHTFSGGLLVSLVSLIICGCAGPTSPFGSAPYWKESMHKLLHPRTELFSQNSGPAIAFDPPRQVLHRSTHFEIKVLDPEGIREGYQFHILYEGRDVTSQFLKRSQIEWEPKYNRWMKMRIAKIRLKSSVDSDIVVSYQASKSNDIINASLEAPRCQLFAHRPLEAISEFQVTQKVLDWINESAGESELNPSLLAGLIAQESGFDSRAMSSARALGLTQITPSGQAEVIKNFPQWPQFDGANELPIPYLKYLISVGEMNSSNEWRLNPKMSIWGGTSYIRTLTEYWQRHEKIDMINRLYENPDLVMPKVILASYNSGATRVSQAMELHGDHWFGRGEDLGAARKYVNRVMSYCDQFGDSSP